MSLKQSLAKAVFAAPLIFAMAANANAAEVKELGLIDLSRPIAQGVCVSDSINGKAHDKIEAIKKARGQVTVIDANTVQKADTSGNPHARIQFTSNLKAAETKGFLGEGYVILSNAPKGKNATTYCIETANDMTGVTSAITGKKVPNTVNIGDLGIGLTNSMNNADSKVGYLSITSEKTLLAVNFNYKTGKGGYMMADGAGKNVLPLPLVDVEYSLELPLAYQKALGIPVERIASSGQLVAAAPK